MSFQNFGKILAKMRKEKNMTQEELAEKLNVSSKTISKWETGTSIPDIVMLDSIAKYFKMSFHDFLDLCLSKENSIESELKLRMKKYTKTIKKKMIFVTLCIALIYTGIYYCLKLYYKPEVFDLISDNEYLTIAGTYLDSPINSKIVINSLRYYDENIGTNMEIKTNFCNIYVYDEMGNLLLKGERKSNTVQSLNTLLSSENLTFDKRLKSNNIFDHNYQTLTLLIEYGTRENEKINSIIKIYDY